MKKLSEIAWNVPESVYREDPALSYSTLSRFDREGFEKLDSLFDKQESPSLLLGSIVDTILTDGEEEFNNRFIVADYPTIPDSIIQIVKELFNRYSETCNNINLISNDAIIEVAAIYNYQNNWKPETRAKVIKEKGFQYYNLLYLSIDKTLVSQTMYNDAVKMVDALRESAATHWYFADNNPFEPDIERYYQLKFKATLHDVDYRCMADLIICDHKNKELILCDLKTSGHPEYEFASSFLTWNYSYQARLYARVIAKNIRKDSYFKDFKLSNYRFIVVNKDTLNPLVWEFPYTFTTGDIRLETKSGYIKILRDPENIGKELSPYLTSRPRVPNGIDEFGTNNIVEWINKI